MMTNFQISVEQSVLDDLHTRLSRYRGLPSLEIEGWEDGVDVRYLDELVTYWRDQYDWRAQEAALNRLSHFLVNVDGTRLHFVHAKGRGPAPMPLILVHGWPDGFKRFLKIIPLLTDPASHGADPADAFDVVVPSLPGFGFSERGKSGPKRSEFGTLLHRLMTEILGYDTYGAQGGDIGAAVCDQLYSRHAESLVGVHFTNVAMRHQSSPIERLTNAERLYQDRMAHFQKWGGGYMHIQGTKPWTPAVALNDSPAGLAAWIVEKMQAWSDCAGDIETRFSKDELLTNVMLYWVTETIGSSFLSYRDFMKPRGEDLAEAPTTASVANATPAGFAVFPEEIANAPREWAERFYHVRHWSEMPAGGHFAAHEEPASLAEDLRTFFRPMRPARDKKR